MIPKSHQEISQVQQEYISQSVSSATMWQKHSNALWRSNVFFLFSSLFPCSRTCYKVYSPSLLSNNLCCNQSHCVNIQGINLHLYNHTAAEYLCRQHAEHTVSHLQQTSGINSEEFVCTMALQNLLPTQSAVTLGISAHWELILKLLCFVPAELKRGT